MIKVKLSSNRILLIICLIFYSCRPNCKDRTSGIVVIDVEYQIGKYQTVSANEYISDLEYIPLETNDSCIMGRINQLFVGASHILIKGQNGMISFCYAFTRDWKFLGKIGSYGHRPSEYTYINFMSIDENKEYVYLSTRGNKILSYSWNGDFLMSINIPQIGAFVDKIVFMCNNLFVGHVCNNSGQEMHNFFIFNDSGTIVKKRTLLLDTDLVSGMPGLINDLDCGLSFWPRYYSSDNELVDIWLSHEMKEILTEEYFAAHQINDPAAHQRLKAVLKEFKCDDNSVIVIVKLK
ncbi:MAG: 6-bladed beta-propeller [Tannerella sp.]|jgi:hypothetical protein|nr:6-bladed beta-propeller [Tannerella sp.]